MIGKAAGTFGILGPSSFIDVTEDCESVWGARCVAEEEREEDESAPLGRSRSVA